MNYNLKIINYINCSICNSDLSLKNDQTLSCVSCGNEINTSNGLVYNDSDNDYYWGEIPLNQMLEVLSISRSSHWSKAIEEVVDKHHPDLKNMILAEDRIEWINFFNEDDLTILDVGGGWGQTGYLLAQNKQNSVISLEKIKARAEFQAIRAAQDKLENLRIVNGDLFETRFKSNSFDLVTYIGVLEWLGVSEKLDSPRDVQLLALKKTHDVLKKDGSVCIGIENRIGFNNFLGAKDHSGLRFTSLMPRKIADLYLKIRKPRYRANVSRSAYRTYTYSASGYKALLKEAGFRTVNIYVSHPHYAHPKCLINYSNSDVRSFFSSTYRATSIKDLIFVFMFRLTSFFGLGHFFAPHFIVIGVK